VEKTPQLLVTGWVVRGINCPVVLAEEFLALLFGEVSQDREDQAGPRGHPGRPSGQGPDFACLCKDHSMPTLIACRNRV